MNKTTASIIGAAGLGLLALAVPPTTSATAGPATTAAAQVTLTYRLAAKDAESKFVDVGRKGESVGDHYLSAVTLKADGEIAGRLQGDCAVLDNTYEGHLCQLVLIVDGGQITLAAGGVNKRIPNVGGKGDIFAVTGGTGAYQGAGGELTVSDDGSRVTVSIIE